MDANRAVASLYRINPTIQFEERRVTSINGVEYSHLDMKAFMRRYWYPYIATAYVDCFLVKFPLYFKAVISKVVTAICNDNVSVFVVRNSSGRGTFTR